MCKKRIYLDNCCYNRPFDDQSQIRVFLETQSKIHIQNLIIRENLELAYSYMSVYENYNNPNKDNSKIIEDFFVFATVYIDPNQAEVVENRAEKIKTQGIKNKDAIHLACAIEAKCDYFLTTDDGILKRYAEKDIKVCSPIEFLTVYEAENAQPKRHQKRGYQLSFGKTRTFGNRGFYFQSLTGTVRLHPMATRSFVSRDVASTTQQYGRSICERLLFL